MGRPGRARRPAVPPITRDEWLAAAAAIAVSGRLPGLILGGRCRRPHHALEDLQVAGVELVHALEAGAHELALGLDDLVPADRPPECRGDLQVMPGLLVEQ